MDKTKANLLQDIFYSVQSMNITEAERKKYIEEFKNSVFKREHKFWLNYIKSSIRKNSILGKPNTVIYLGSLPSLSIDAILEEDTTASFQTRLGLKSYQSHFENILEVGHAMLTPEHRDLKILALYLALEGYDCNYVNKRKTKDSTTKNFLEIYAGPSATGKYTEDEEDFFSKTIESYNNGIRASTRVSVSEIDYLAKQYGFDIVEQLEKTLNSITSTWALRKEDCQTIIRFTEKDAQYLLYLQTILEDSLFSIEPWEKLIQTKNFNVDDYYVLDNEELAVFLKNLECQPKSITLLELFYNSIIRP